MATDLHPCQLEIVLHSDDSDYVARVAANDDRYSVFRNACFHGIRTAPKNRSESSTSFLG
jgi:hypothetical protein